VGAADHGIRMGRGGVGGSYWNNSSTGQGCGGVLFDASLKNIPQCCDGWGTVGLKVEPLEGGVCLFWVLWGRRK